MIHVGVDLHRRFCYMTALRASGEMVGQQRVENDARSLGPYFRQWGEPVEVAVEACSFWPAFVEAVEPLVARVVLVHPQRVKAIASAKLKNDRVDSATLAHLLRAQLLPEAWKAEAPTRELRQQVRLRVALGQQRARLKNQVHAVLHQQGQRAPVRDLWGRRGQQWLAAVELPPAARQAVNTYGALIGQFDGQIEAQEKVLQDYARQDERVRWLETIPGIGPYAALVVLAEIGSIERFRSKRQLYSYAGLVPRVRESAERRWRGGITRCGSPRLRWILVEAAHSAIRSSPAARAYFERLGRRKHRQVARVALARKLLGAIWALLHHGVCFEEEVFAAV